MKKPKDSANITCPLPRGDEHTDGNITLKDNYVLAEGSKVLLEIIQQNQKEGITQPPAVRLWLRFPSKNDRPGRDMMLIQRMNVPIPEGDGQSLEWYHRAEAEGKQAQALASMTNVLIRDTPEKDAHVDFICEMDLSAISDFPGKHISTHPTSLHGMHIVGFFVPHSGRSALSLPPWELTDCDGGNSTEVNSLHAPV